MFKLKAITFFCYIVSNEVWTYDLMQSIQTPHHQTNPSGLLKAMFGRVKMKGVAWSGMAKANNMFESNFKGGNGMVKKGQGIPSLPSKTPNFDSPNWGVKEENTLSFLIKIIEQPNNGVV